VLLNKSTRKILFNLAIYNNFARIMIGMTLQGRGTFLILSIINPSEANTMVQVSQNPCTGEILATYPMADSMAVQSVLDQAESAFLDWRSLSFEQRALFLRAAAQALRNARDVHARAITMEMGKPVTQSNAEVEKCAWVCDFYADNAKEILRSESVETDASNSFVRFDPLGCILAVMPWNFPYWQVFRFAAPALMAGNICVLKHASNVPQCAMLIEDVFRRAGLPPGVFSTLLISSSQVEQVIRHSAVRAVTLTGSEPAGASVASIAGSALKKTVLELGGSDPFIVLADADLQAAAKVAVTARLQNTGQSCIAAKRFIVEAPVADRFVELFAREMASKHVGDPMLESTDVGPMAREDLLLDLDSQVKRSIDMGAEAVYGTGRIEHKGYFYKPGILTGVRPGMPAFDEELFGPVAAVTAAGSRDEAVALANASAFGLGASLWTSDMKAAEKMAASIEAGSVFVNGMVKSDPRLPFGGIRKSGYGRELSSYGIKEFVNIKTVWMK
jgi:succinate-semialdehyde dehydrogenase/glutarate-semialdehyde dehydrogenase